MNDQDKFGQHDNIVVTGVALAIIAIMLFIVTLGTSCEVTKKANKETGHGCAFGVPVNEL